MDDQILEFGGVRYWLSASAEGDEFWVGEANVLLHGNHFRTSQIIPTPERYANASKAMHMAKEQLKALHLSDALRLIVPDAYGPKSTQ